MAEETEYFLPELFGESVTDDEGNIADGLVDSIRLEDDSEDEPEKPEQYAKTANADVPPAVKREHIDVDCEQYGKAGTVADDAIQEHVDDLRMRVEQAANATEREPSDAQKEAGNYAKGRVTVQGLPITIENPAGSIRRGTNAAGESWETEIPHHYGYIRRTESEADGDHIDVFLGPELDSRIVYVIDRHNPKTDAFDEHKCMVGWRSEAEAVSAYKSAYDDEHHGFKAVMPMSMPEFRNWLESGDTSKPIAGSV